LTGNIFQYPAMSSFCVTEKLPVTGLASRYCST
jgi:hypothetical protein